MELCAQGKICCKSDEHLSQSFTQGRVYCKLHSNCYCRYTSSCMSYRKFHRGISYKIARLHMYPAKTDHAGWSESSLATFRQFGSLATHKWLMRWADAYADPSLRWSGTHAVLKEMLCPGSFWSRHFYKGQKGLMTALYTVELQWLEPRWLVYHGWVEHVLESAGISSKYDIWII